MAIGQPLVPPPERPARAEDGVASVLEYMSQEDERKKTPRPELVAGLGVGVTRYCHDSEGVMATRFESRSKPAVSARGL